MTAPGTSFPSEIRGGIEWFTVQPGQVEGQCARCGSSIDFARCGNCDEFGNSHHDCGEDCCACLDPDENNVRCDWCGGTGGSWHCISTRDYCLAHPMAGREQVESTAFSDARAWDD